MAALIFWSLFWGAVFALSGAAENTSGDASREGEFVGRSDVLLVEVPVEVHTRGGEAVRGLELADFELWEEGEEREIASFQAFDLERLGAVDQPGARRGAQVPAVARRHFLLLFDLAFSSPGAIVRARGAALDFVLETLHPSDLAAVAVYTLEEGPRLLTSFTPDRAQLARAIDTLGETELLERGEVVDPLRLVIEDPRLAISAPLEGGVSGGMASGSSLWLLGALNDTARQLELGEREFERRRVAAWARAFEEMAGHLAGVAGPKRVLYFSEGFDSRLLFGRGAGARDFEARRDRRELEHGQFWRIDAQDTFGSGELGTAVTRALEAFTRAGLTIHAIDVAGLRGSEATDGSLTVAGSASDRDGRRDALFHLAETTGGRLIDGTHDLGAALERAFGDPGTIYVLSFYAPEDAPPGQFRHLRVELREPGKKRLEHRGGYFVPRGFAELHPLERELLASEAIAGATPRRELDLAVLAVPFEVSGGARVAVLTELGGAELLAERRGGALPLELYVYATDGRGRIRDLFTENLDLDLGRARPALEAGGLSYLGYLDLEAGEYLVRVLARDGENGRTAVAGVEVRVTGPESAGARLSPPLFPETELVGLRLRESSPADSEGRVVYPFVAAGQPFVPRARPRILETETAHFFLVAHGLPEGPVALGGALEGPGGVSALDPRLELVARSGQNPEVLEVAFDPRGLEPGVYRFELSVVAGGELAKSFAELEIGG